MKQYAIVYICLMVIPILLIFVVVFVSENERHNKLKEFCAKQNMTSMATSRFNACVDSDGLIYVVE